MSACSTFTEHVWKPGECKNCFKPKSLHCLAQSGGGKPPSEQRPASNQQQIPPPVGARANPNLIAHSQRAGSGSARSGHFRPPVAKKPTIAVKPTMMLPCSSAVLDSDGNPQHPVNATEQGKTSAFTVCNRNGLNCKRPSGPSNNNVGEEGSEEIEGYGHLSPRTPSGNNNSGLTDVLKEIAGLGPDCCPTPQSGSKDLFWGRISSSYRRSLERGLPASSCLAIGSSSSGGGGTALKRVSLSNSTEIISTEGGRFCYPEFSSEGEDDDDDDEDEDEDEDTDQDDDEHESWDESDEELLAMEIRMRGQPRFANFRAATLSPVPFAAGKKWNTVPLRNRSLQRICAVDYDDSYDEILNGYPSMNSNGSLLPYGPRDMQGSAFMSNSESTTSPESSSSLPEDSQTTSSSGGSAHCALRNGLQSPKSCKPPVPCTSPTNKESVSRALSPLKHAETHTAVLAIRLEDKDRREGMPMPKALPGQPVTISFSPTEEQAKPYRVVNLEKSLICKPYTVVDVSASMASKDEQFPDSSVQPKNLSKPTSPTLFSSTSVVQPLSPVSPMFPSSPVMPTSPPSAALSPRKKSGCIRYQEVWTSSTSPRQKIPKVDLAAGSNPGPSIPAQFCSHKSAPTSPIAGLSSSRTVPVKSPNLSEIKFNSFNNAGMPPFPIIIRDEPAYARSSKNAVKVPIVINPSAYDNLAVYKSFLGLHGELPQAKGVGSRVTSHTYEEIGSSESVQTSSTEKTLSGTGTSTRASFEEIKLSPEKGSKAANLQPRTTTDSSTVLSTVMTSTAGALSASLSTNCPASTAHQTKTSLAANAVTNKTGSDASCIKDDDTSLSFSCGTVVGHREEASAVLSQIVASIQPPQSPPESPSAQSKTFSSEELYALPPDAMKESPLRPKSLFSTHEGCLSKPKKDNTSKVLSKSQSASAAVPLPSPRSEPNAPFPPPRSTSSPYHASNIIQRHFGNWTKSSASSSPLRPSEGEASPGGEGRRVPAESAKPKRWISFKSFFRRRKDEDEQREKAEKDKEKGKLVGLDGTVIHVLPPPPAQHQHWFAEAKPEDPTQKPTIIFTFKPDTSSNPGTGEGELRIEECRETDILSTHESKESAPPSPDQTSKNAGGDVISKDPSQLPASNARDREVPTATSLPAKVNLGLVLGEREHGHASPAVTPASASEGSASLGEPEEDGNLSHHSHSPASSLCSATYSNLGQSRANMIPLKQPRNIKASNDTLASIDFDGFTDQPTPKATPPPLPKKAVPRSTTEPALGVKEPIQGPIRPRAEAKPGGTNLSVANPLYDLDSTWETASQSSSHSSEPHRAHESGDSLERPSSNTACSTGRLANSVSSLVTPPAPATPTATAGRERKVFPSTESLAGRGRTAGRGVGAAAAGGSKPQRPALYRGLDTWDEVVGRIRGLHTDTLRKLASKCEDRFMAGQKDHLRFGTDSWSHFRLTTGKPCCEAGDAVYYTASYAKDPLVNYAIKICRSHVKETQQQFFHSLAVRQSLPVHFNIQQDCGHFLADVPTRLLPWVEDVEEEKEEKDEEGEREPEEEVKLTDSKASAPNGKLDEAPAAGNMNTTGRLRSRVVVITREVPFQTVADFVREGMARHAHNPELYERQVCLLLLQLCSGLEHMKPYHVTHCDLRLENLLLVQCQPGNPWNLDVLEPNNNGGSSGAGTTAANAAANATCPARLIISNFSQAKQKSNLMATDPSALRDQSRLAPEIITATQYRKCDEFQTGILIYEMLHRPNPFEETPELKEREYTWADLPPLPVKSLYSHGLQQLARLLLTVNPSERIRMSEARACLQCLLWGPREDLFQALGCSNTGPVSGATAGQREATLQNWLDLKRTLMMIKFAERSLDAACSVSLEDWLCCHYLAFASTETLSRVVHILQPPPHAHSQPPQAAPSQAQTHLTHTVHLAQSQPL